jgi:hypothetical protein
LAELPDAALSGLTSLTSLQVGGNRFRVFPPPVLRIRHLLDLDLGGAGFASVPAAIGARLPRLQRLHLAGCATLTTFPAAISKCCDLTSLDVSGCPLLREFPGGACKLRGLVSLAVDARLGFPRELAGVASLERLNGMNVEVGQTKRMPDDVRARLAVCSSGLAGLGLACVDGLVGLLGARLLAPSIGVTEMDLSGNSLVTLPGSLGGESPGWRALRKLDVSGNASLAALPASVCGLPALRVLAAAGCSLRALPDALGRLTTLRQLHLQDNALEALPDSLGGLSRLETLRLQRNELRTLPASVGSLLRLKSLFIGGNPLLESLPVSVGTLQVDNPFGNTEERVNAVGVRCSDKCNIRAGSQGKARVALKLVGSAASVKGAVKLDYSGLGLHVPDAQKAALAKQLGGKCELHW